MVVREVEDFSMVTPSTILKSFLTEQKYVLVFSTSFTMRLVPQNGRWYGKVETNLLVFLSSMTILKTQRLTFYQSVSIMKHQIKSRRCVCAF